MNIKDIFLIIGPLVSAMLSSYLTYYFAIRKKQKESILKFKEDKYLNLLILLQGFVGETASSEIKKKFFEEQYKSWLYSSDDVVKAINNMVNLVITQKGKTPDSNDGRKAIGDIVLAMRKDLLGKSKLNFNDFKYTDVIDRNQKNS